MTERHTDREWEQWGKKNPYLGVLGVETAAVLSDPKVRVSFFETGESHIEHVLSVVAAQFGPVAGKALDFGCGVGRLLAPLSRRFDEVVGVDISQSMLDLATANLEGSANVRLARTLESVAGQYDLVHTYIVLQHIRPRHGMALIRQLLDATKPGGVFAIHVNIGDLDKRREVLNVLRYRVRPVHWLHNLARRRPVSEPITEMNKYDAAALFDMYSGATREPLIALTTTANNYVSLMVIGRRSTGVMA